MSEHPCKVTVMAGIPLAIPTLNGLYQQGMLAGVVLAAEPDMFNSQLEAWLHQQQIPCARYQAQSDEQFGQLLMQWETDMALNFNLPVTALPVSPALGFYHIQTDKNLYWAIRERHDTFALVASDGEQQTMLHQWDIHPLDTSQAADNRLTEQSGMAVLAFIDALRLGEPVQWQGPAGELTAQPTQADLYVDWTRHTGQTIAAMARAGNSQLGGCVVVLNATPLSLMQATPIEFATHGVAPGTICHSGEPKGMVVATLDGALRLDVISNSDGVFSAQQFAQRFQIHAGMAFTATPTM